MEFKMKLIIGLWCFVLVYAQNRTIPVRLVGSDGIQGDVEIYDKLSCRWRGLCDDGWNLKAATVVCRQLNLGPPVSIYSHSTGSPYVDYGIENVTCIGTESNIAECNFTTDHDCYRHESAGVICSPIQIRLIGGMYKTWKNRTRDGRVEMLSNGEWGTICDVGFDKQDADVMCRQLGFPGAKRLGIPGEYGNGNTAMPIHLSHLECTGTESEIYQCNGNEQPTGCSHNNDVSVECLPLVQLTNGNATSDGQLEILYQGEWYATCSPDRYNYHYYYYYYYYRYPSYNNDGDVICKELGYYGGVVISGRRRQLTNENRHQLWYYDLYCDGTENSVYDCTGQYGYDDFYPGYCSYLAEYSCQSLQLSNRINATGILQFLDISGRVPVCFTDAFNEFAADVACQQLGYPFATNFISEALTHSLLGIGITGTICRETNAYGYEGYLFNCVNFTKMICQTQLHLSCYDGDTVRLTQGPVKHMGRVEVFDRRSDHWGTICANDVSSYQYNLASIICKSLGYYSYRHYGHASNSSNIGLSSNSPIVNGSIRCSYIYSSHVYQNLYQCLDFESHLEPSPSRCTPDQEWILICTPLVDLNGMINTRYVNHYQGSVVLYNSKKLTYEYICDDGWDLNDAHVVCRMLGFSGAHDATFRSEYGQPNVHSVSLSNVQCSGTEDSIFDCPHEYNSNCIKSRIAGVQCLATRLVDGPNQYSGRIEIYNIHTYQSYNSYTIFPYQWGTVCDTDQWTVQDATVLCRSLGYQFNEENLPRNQSYGLATGLVWTRYVSCSGNEHYIWDCSYSTNNYYTYYNGQYTYRPYCNHSADIGIVCSAPLPVRLQGSPYTSVGRLEVWRNNMWGSVCNEHFTIEAANVVCRQLGFDQAMDYTPGGYFGQSTGPIHMSNVSCTGNEAAITDCTFSTTHSCDHSQDVGIYCQDIRLIQGTDATEGIIEIYEDNRWGILCNNSFNTVAATIVCRQLRLGLPVLYHGNSLIENSEVHYAYYQYYYSTCSETSQRFSHCFYYYSYFGSCYETFLKCSSVRLEDSDSNYTGRVEVFYNGEWGTICSDGFDQNDAAVVCRQAGYGPPVRYWIDPSHRRHGRIWIDNLQCDGTEDTLFECRSTTWGNTNCDHTQDIFIECAGFCEQSINSTDYIVTYEMTPSYAQSTATLRCIGYPTAETGSAICDSNGEWIIEYPKCEAPVRLVDESEDGHAIFANVIDYPYRGRVEVLMNGEWYTVCSEGLGFKEANVICNQLGFNGARRVSTRYYGEGIGGIVAFRNRGCDGGEIDILNCDLQLVSASNSDCHHSEDAGIECLDVRLISTNNIPYSGRIEVFFNNEWGQVCSQENTAVLFVVCAQLGFGSAGAVPYSPGVSRNTRIWLTDSIDCVGNEDTIFDCPSLEYTDIGKVPYGYCSDGAAGVICPITACLPFLPKNGYYVHDIQQTYRPNNFLQIACKDGYDLISLESDSTFGAAECQTDGTWNDTFFCEKRLYLTYGFKSSVGHVEIFDKYQNDYKPVCDRNWDLNDANVVCHQLGYPGAVRATTRSYFTYRSSSSSSQQSFAIFNNVDCTGMEESLFNCLDTFGMPLDISTLDSCPSQSSAGVICNENIRLTGGSSIYEGQVEIFINGQWGTVCSNGIGTNEAETLCQSLGFGPFQSISNNLTGNTTNVPLAISDLRCTEGYDHFMKCTFNHSSPMCSVVSNLGLKCYPAVRFVEDSIRSPWEGEIEVYYDGQWDRVCNTDWDINDAEVVCRELGFTGTISAEYSKATHNFHASAILDGALCTGEELHLLDCPRFVPLSNVTTDCLGNYAGVTCMTECPILTSPEFGNIVSVTGNTFNDTTVFECFENFILMGSSVRRCQHNGQWSGTATKCVGIRLVDGMNVAQGRIEIYYEGEWGTICDRGWDINDGTVICCQLGYQQALTITTGASNFGPGNGPVQLQDVACKGNESNLFMCSFPRSESTCLHDQDAGVICADCPVLQQPEYGSVSSVLNNPLSGNHLSFSCDNGYNLLGSAERTCMPNGTWSGTTVTCQATCTIEDAIKDTNIKVDPVRSQYVPGAEITVFCNSEYQIINSSKPFVMRVCLSDRTWSGIDPQCEKISGLSTSTNQRQTSNDESGTSDTNSTVVIVLAVILGLIVLGVIIGIVTVYVKKRIAQIKERSKSTYDNKRVIVNPIYGDEADETN